MSYRDSIPPRARRYASILREVSQETGIPLRDIFSRSRLKPHAAARRMALLRVKAASPHLSSRQLGAIFDRKCVTILYLLGRTKEGREYAARMSYREAAE